MSQILPYETRSTVPFVLMTDIPRLANAAVPFADGDLIASLIDRLSSFNNGDAAANTAASPSTGRAAQSDIAVGTTDSEHWSVQIGAFANEATANVQLQIYAERSADVLREADRLIVPYPGEGGRTFYRARFGPFEESEARAVCQHIITRGETCFASQTGPDT